MGCEIFLLVLGIGLIMVGIMCLIRREIGCVVYCMVMFILCGMLVKMSSWIM